MRVILLGAPGAGKGTQAVAVAQRLGPAHIASGDLFREAMAKGTELGLLAKSYIEKGLLVPDGVTVKMILERIAEEGANFILDGFPRNKAQAMALDLALGEEGIDKVVYIRVSTEELLRRLSGRWICRVCQTPYHTLNAPPRVPGVCDRCGGQLYQRADDTDETVRKRLEVYFAQTTPVIDYYRRRGKLVEINGEQGVEAVTAELAEALRQ